MKWKEIEDRREKMNEIKEKKNRKTDGIKSLKNTKVPFVVFIRQNLTIEFVIRHKSKMAGCVFSFRRKDRVKFLIFWFFDFRSLKFFGSFAPNKHLKLCDNDFYLLFILSIIFCSNLEIVFIICSNLLFLSVEVL